MTLPLTFPVVFLIAVVAQALFAAALLLAAPANRLPNRLLAALLIAVALWELDALGRVGDLYGQNPDLYFSPIYYSLGFGPLLWSYVRALTNDAFRWRWRAEWPHLLPVAAQAGLYGWLRMQTYATRSWFWETVHQPVTYRVEFIGTWVSLVVYLGLSLALLRRYAHWLPDNFSELSALRLRWLRVVLWLLAAISGQWLVEAVLRESFGIYYDYDYSTWLLGGALLLLGAGGLRQADMRAVVFDELRDDALRVAGAELREAEGTPNFSGVASGHPEGTPNFSGVVSGHPEGTPNFSGVASGHPEGTPNFSGVASRHPEGTPNFSGILFQPLAAEAAARPFDPVVLARIQRALETEGLYRNPTLTLAELAAHTRLAPRLISATINAGFGRPFADVVNGLRVAEVQRQLADPAVVARLSLLGIAFEAGFNSKTTFNRVFKEVTGSSPSEWRA